MHKQPTADGPRLLVPSVSGDSNRLVIGSGWLSAIGDCADLSTRATGAQSVECDCWSGANDLPTFAHVVFPLCGASLRRLHVSIKASILASSLHGDHSNVVAFLDACATLPHLAELSLDLHVDCSEDRFASLIRQWTMNHNVPWLTSALAEATGLPGVLVRLISDMVKSSVAMDDVYRELLRSTGCGLRHIRLVLRRHSSAVSLEQDFFWAALMLMRSELSPALWEVWSC